MSKQTRISKIRSLLSQGRPEAALSAARMGARQARKDPDFPNLAGIALSQGGQHHQAAAQFRKALSLAPTYLEARRNLAQALLLDNEPAEALRRVQEVLTQTPRAAPVLLLRAQALAALGQKAEALQAVDQAIAADPGLAAAHRTRAEYLAAAGQEPEAVQAWQAALALEPRNVEVMVALSQPLMRLGQLDQAEALMDRAVQTDPNHQGAALRRAAQYLETGRSAQAAKGYRQLLAASPAHPLALEALAPLVDKPEAQALADTARQALRHVDLPDQDRPPLHFALARLMRKLGDNAAMSMHLAEANAAMAQALPYDAKGETALTDRLIARADTLGPAPEAQPPQGPCAIYVVGLPRAGTTLTERMLGNHPRIQPLGERGTPGALLADVINGDRPFDAAARAEFAAQDRARLPQMPPDALAYVDKMPENFRLIGFLLSADPAARVIHVTRDPRDIALSLWQERFSGTALAYAYDLAAMAHRMNAYARLMRHWQATFPDRILTLPYEDLVADPATQTRKLADFCGVDWAEPMAHPESGQSPVLTVSATQVRQPVHGRSVGGWRQHAQMLTPVLQGLDPALWPGLS